MSNGVSRYARIVIDPFNFRGLCGRESQCTLEVLPVSEGRTLVIATELPDNSGTSVTNAAEHLASFVCDSFGIAPGRLVWIEHYGASPGVRKDETYDLVTFEESKPQQIHWLPAVLRHQPDGWPGHFAEPTWRPMTAADWQALGLAPRLQRA